MISVTEARALIAQIVAPLPPVRLPLAESLGQILRETIKAPSDFPAFDRSAMDGYAVALDDTSEQFRAVMEVQAQPTEGVNRQQQQIAAARAAAILSHLAVVIGLVLIGARHFDNIRAGISAATLYLLTNRKSAAGQVTEWLRRPAPLLP